jgi:hypothetical protein
MTNEQASFTVGGDFFKPANGGYYGIFRGTRNGPPQTRTENGHTKTQKTVIWMFDGYNLDGTPLLDPAKGTQAIIEGMSSTSLGIGKGVPAKGRHLAPVHPRCQGHRVG